MSKTEFNILIDRCIDLARKYDDAEKTVKYEKLLKEGGTKKDLAALMGESELVYFLGRLKGEVNENGVN